MPFYVEVRLDLDQISIFQPKARNQYLAQSSTHWGRSTCSPETPCSTTSGSRVITPQITPTRPPYPNSPVGGDDDNGEESSSWRRRRGSRGRDRTSRGSTERGVCHASGTSSCQCHLFQDARHHEAFLAQIIILISSIAFPSLEIEQTTVKTFQPSSLPVGLSYIQSGESVQVSEAVWQSSGPYQSPQQGTAKSMIRRRS